MNVLYIATTRSQTPQQRKCGYYFPGAQPVSSARILGTDDTYKGRDINVQTVFFVTGNRKLLDFATATL